MNKISCNVIGDLLPLYVDGAVSEDAKKLVEEHLAECEECKKVAEEMGKELVLPVHETVRAAETSFLQKMKKTWQKRRIRTAVISVAVTIGLVFGIYMALILPEWAIPYDPNMIYVEELDEGRCVMVSYAGGRHCSSYGYMGEDGYYLYATHNLWTAYIEPLFYKTRPEDCQITTILDEENVSKIYYGEFDKGLDGYSLYGQEDEMQKQTHLIWTRDEVMP